MSCDIYFLDRAFVGRWDDGMRQLEEATVGRTRVDDHVDWAPVLAAVRAKIPDIEQRGERTLYHPTTHATLVHHPGQISLNIPWSVGPVRLVVHVLSTIAQLVEQQTGLIAYVPQADHAFVDGERLGKPLLSVASHLVLQRKLGGQRLGISTATLALLTPDELASLRSSKGDPARRSRAQSLLQSLSADRAFFIGEEWTHVQQVERSLGPDARSIFSGTPLHKGNACRIHLFTELEEGMQTLRKHTDESVISAALRLNSAGREGSPIVADQQAKENQTI